MSLTYRAALVILVIGLVSIASSQLIVKWRYGAIAKALTVNAGVLDVLVAVIADPWMWAAATLIGTSVVSWYVALAKLPLSFMFPIAGIVTPTVALGAHVLLGEPLSHGQMGAIAMITAGVVLLGLLQ